MKINEICVYLLLICFSFVSQQCAREKRTDIRQNSNDRTATNENRVVEKDGVLDNKVINETIQSVLDSLNNQILLNFKNDPNKVPSIIYYVDSLLKPRYSYPEINHMFFTYEKYLDTIYLKNYKSKLYIKGLKLNSIKDLIPLSSLSDIKTMSKNNDNKFLLLIFTSVGFNKERSIGFFTVDLSCSLNAGSEYAVLAEKVNNKWKVKRMIESGIR
jgi:hypothetical protein